MSSSWKPSNFYVYVTYDSLSQTSLRMPIEFTKEHGEQILLNSVLLTVSDNKIWSMGWMISGNGHFWLRKGWTEFAEHYRIKIGYLLLFNHWGSFMFHVRIFDRSSCEINYSLHDIDQSVHMTTEVNMQDIKVNTDLVTGGHPLSSATITVPYSQSSGLSAAAMSSRWKLSNFHVFVTYDSISQTSLRMPVEFTKEHGEQILLNSVSVTVSGNKTWSMDWMISGNGHFWLQKGWPDFAEHYRIKIGYLLLFNHQGSFIFHVRIFNRSSCEINYSLPEVNIHDIKVNSDLATAGRPLCSATITVPYFSQSSGLRIPIAYCRRYLTCERECVDCFLHMSDGRNWGPVNCKAYKKSGKMYGENWEKFSNENHLRVGDVCVFELMTEIENALRVTIIRAKLK